MIVGGILANEDLKAIGACLSSVVLVGILLLIIVI
jgi:hypothetical protein